MRKKRRSFFTERFKSIKLPGAQDIKSSAVRICVFLLAVGLLFPAYASMRRFLLNCAVFGVRRIDLRMEPRLKAAEHFTFYGIESGINIFAADIGKIGRRVKDSHPEFKDVIIGRRFPDALSADITYKEPEAFIPAHHGRKFVYDNKYVKYEQSGGDLLIPVAGDGTVLPPGVLKDKTLPVLIGLDFGQAVVKIGDAYSDKRFEYAVRFLKELNSLWNIDDYKVRSLDISSVSNTAVFLDNGLEVKFGDGNLREKLAALKKVLERGRLEPSAVRYVDLRFKDVIINPR